MNAVICRNVRTNAANVRTEKEENKTDKICAEVNSEETVIVSLVLCVGYCPIEMRSVKKPLSVSMVLVVRLEGQLA